MSYWINLFQTKMYLFISKVQIQNFKHAIVFFSILITIIFKCEIFQIQTINYLAIRKFTGLIFKYNKSYRNVFQSFFWSSNVHQLVFFISSFLQLNFWINFLFYKNYLFNRITWLPAGWKKKPIKYFLLLYSNWTVFIYIFFHFRALFYYSQENLLYTLTFMQDFKSTCFSS